MAKGELSPGERSLRSRLAAYTRWSREDPHEAMSKVREKGEKHWLDQVDPDRELPEEERYRRVEAAKKAHYTRLSLTSVQARRKKASRHKGQGSDASQETER